MHVQFRHFQTEVGNVSNVASQSVDNMDLCGISMAVRSRNDVQNLLDYISPPILLAMGIRENSVMS